MFVLRSPLPILVEEGESALLLEGDESGYLLLEGDESGHLLLEGDMA